MDNSFPKLGTQSIYDIVIVDCWRCMNLFEKPLLTVTSLLGFAIHINVGLSQGAKANLAYIAWACYAFNPKEKYNNF